MLERRIFVCRQAIEDMQQIVNKLAKTLEKHEKLRGRLYFVCKEQDIEELLDKLRRAKSSIQLAYSMYLAEEQRQRNESQSSQTVRHKEASSGLWTQIASQSSTLVQQMTLLRSLQAEYAAEADDIRRRLSKSIATHMYCLIVNFASVESC